jgi:hypothetical protein
LCFFRQLGVDGPSNACRSSVRTPARQEKVLGKRPPANDTVLKSSYYSAAQLGRLKGLAERKKTKEAVLLREALEDVLHKYDRE